MPNDGSNGSNLMWARQQPKIPILDFLSAQGHAIMAILPGSSGSSQAHSSQERDGRSSVNVAILQMQRDKWDAVVVLLQHYIEHIDRDVRVYYDICRHTWSTLNFRFDNEDH